MHAEIAFGNACVMVSDAFPEWGSNGPRAIGGTPVTISVYVEDVDATIARAAEAGATVISPPENQFWGDRSGTIEDPFGHHWHLGSHVEDVSLEELERRAAAMREGFEAPGLSPRPPAARVSRRRASPGSARRAARRPARDGRPAARPRRPSPTPPEPQSFLSSLAISSRSAGGRPVTRVTVLPLRPALVLLTRTIPSATGAAWAFSRPGETRPPSDE